MTGAHLKRSGFIKILELTAQMKSVSLERKQNLSLIQKKSWKGEGIVYALRKKVEWTWSSVPHERHNDWKTVSPSRPVNLQYR